jgi:DNA cross-link repair 1B protein
MHAGKSFMFNHALIQDHYDGLHDGWNCGIIYCSPITKKLLLNKFTINPDNVVRIMFPIILTCKKTFETGQTSLLYLDSAQTCSIEVTPIDANHCPGAVMFLFQGYFGRVLYTGDIRFHPSMLLVNKLTENPIDYLYFDNTFCDPMFIFPSQVKI